MNLILRLMLTLTLSCNPVNQNRDRKWQTPVEDLFLKSKEQKIRLRPMPKQTTAGNS